MICSDLVADAFELAWDIRILDLRASPYDLSDLGYSPVKIETPEGKREYADAQRDFAERAAPMRQRLIVEVPAPSECFPGGGRLRALDFPSMATLEPDTLQRMFDAGCDALEADELDRAAELLRPIAEWGVPMAMFNLAIALKRRGDLDESIKWYTEAALAGDVDAMAYLGWMHKLLGNPEEAINWYLLAQRHGHPHAADSMKALSYDNTSLAAATVRATASLAAKGHAQNGFMDMAAQSWMAAADSGDEESMYQLGLQAEGRRDLGEAMLWYKSAIRSGHTEAEQRLTAIAPDPLR